MPAIRNEKTHFSVIIDYRDDDFCRTVYLLSPSSTPPSLTYLSLFSLSGRFQLLWPRWDSVIFNQIWCAASMWSRRAMMMQTWLSWAPAMASSCVRDLMARPGGLKRGKQSSGLLARSARSFIFCFSCSITLLVILTDTLLLPTSSQKENKRNTKMLLILLFLWFTALTRRWFSEHNTHKTMAQRYFCYFSLWSGMNESVAFCLLSPVWTVTSYHGLTARKLQ